MLDKNRIYTVHEYQKEGSAFRGTPLIERMLMLPVEPILTDFHFCKDTSQRVRLRNSYI